MAKKNQDGGSDVDSELHDFFSGMYKAEFGLRSTTGAQLERASFKMGPSQGRMHDGWNDAVKFDADDLGPRGYLAATKAGRAIALLRGDPPAPVEEETPEQLAARQKAQQDWPLFYPVLKGYYTERLWGVHDGLLGAFGEFLGTCLVIPRADVLVRRWCAARCAEELVVNAAAIQKSREDTTKRIERYKFELRVAEPMQKFRWTKKILLASQAPAQLDTEAAIQRRWDPTIEDNRIEALRALVKTAAAPKDTSARKQAKHVIAELIDEARLLRWAGRDAYRVERKRVDRDIKEMKRVRERQGQQDRMEQELQSLARIIYQGAEHE